MACLYLFIRTQPHPFIYILLAVASKLIVTQSSVRTIEPVVHNTQDITVECFGGRDLLIPDLNT